MKLLNIGCGKHFHEAWVNIDLISTSPHVRAHDVRKGLPYPDNTFDAVYSSHVLEHLTPEAAYAALREQFRVLRPGGIVRVVVPDLENKAREYIRLLEQVVAVNQVAEADYDWIVVELLDQMVRDKGGGKMGEYILQPQLSNSEYVVRRIGDEAEEWLSKTQKTNANITHHSLLTRIRDKGIKILVQRVRERLAALCVLCIAGVDAYKAFHEGLFRASGEVHRWMYDRFSLGRLLHKVGFVDIRVCRFDESYIPSFSAYYLDGTLRGTIRKADSLFMEAIKP
ncbi:MAG: methyltransferase domain-containing protein [Candidatus Kapabacteria bacterium]|nr:methyltransferase domain-containing protein [Candidatus Kapabacteria bacterium]